MISPLALSHNQAPFPTKIPVKVYQKNGLASAELSHHSKLKPFRFTTALGT